MGTRRARLRADDGFTLVELIIGIVITSVIIGAIASALIVSFRTTNVTQQRMAESHDAQISSAYLANDVQSAGSVHLGPGGNCSGASTELITFAYASHPAVYSCGTSNGEIQVTRTFDGSSVILAHFAEAARPTVSCSPSADCTGTVASVTIAFAEASGYTYTLLGSRRSYGESGGGGSGPPADVTLLSTGSSSPLWVQGGSTCQDSGTDPAACEVDPSAIAWPKQDLSTAGWSPTPLSDILRNRLDLDTTFVTNAQGGIAQVLLDPVSPPGGTPPTIEFRASSPLQGQPARFRIHIYDGTTMQQLVPPHDDSAPSNSAKNFDWKLSTDEANSIPEAAYQNLVIGFEITNNRRLNVYGIALNTNPAGLLTINGSLYVNSRNSDAVSLTGKKNATKLTIAGRFQILGDSAGGFGRCSGCDTNTVSCPTIVFCGGSASQLWSSYSPSLPDPLRSLPAPDPATLVQNRTCTGSSPCEPGVYEQMLTRTADTTLNPGIYYLKDGISITGRASVTCAVPCAGGVMLYIAGGSVTFAGGSTIDLTAPSSGTYKDIVIFQNRYLSSPVKITGSAGKSTPISFKGIIYVPNSIQVTLATGNATLTAKAIVAQNIKVSSSVTIGP
jgi:prepilin-type N-terminal cleavage/methylation domain-containing protein